jgi:hypothetical protein
MKLPEHVKHSNGGIIGDNMMFKNRMGSKMSHGGSMNRPNLRAFPPAGVRFALGGQIPGQHDIMHDEEDVYDHVEGGDMFSGMDGDLGESFHEDNSGVAEEYSGVDKFAEGGMVSCPKCGHEYAHSGKMDADGDYDGDYDGDEYASELAKPHGVDGKVHRENPDNEEHERRRSFARAIKRSRGG